jgi:hypothetical protein
MYFPVACGMRRRSKPLLPSIATAADSRLFSRVALIAHLHAGDASSCAGRLGVGR